jgi:hypothetical protein
MGANGHGGLDSGPIPWSDSQTVARHPGLGRDQLLRVA